jgi:Protein of unknown function (DUF3592)
VKEGEPGEQPTYAPIVEFEIEEGKYAIKGWASFPPGFQVGQEVAVYYFPHCPDKAQIISRREWFIAGCFLAGGVAFIAFGIAVTLGSEANLHNEK